MFKASSSHFPLAAVLLPPALAGSSMTAQGTSPPQTKLPLKAALVLTPDFCTSRVTHGVPKDPKVGIEAGKVACVDFEPALKEVFTTLSTISSPKDAGDAQVILTPRFVDAGVTTGLTAFSNCELTLFLEWTAQDAFGRTIWLDTVQGSAKHHAGTLFTYKKNAKLIIDYAVQDVAVQSARKMSSSAELRKYTPSMLLSECSPRNGWTEASALTQAQFPFFSITLAYVVSASSGKYSR
jgi:hypothetical protein